MEVKNLNGMIANLNGTAYQVWDEVLDGELHLELHSDEYEILNFVMEDGKALELKTRAEWHDLSNWYNAQ